VHPRDSQHSKTIPLFSILERNYLPRVKYIITSNPVVYITALKTFKESKKEIYNTTIWSSGANCTEIQQTLNEGLSKVNSSCFV